MSSAVPPSGDQNARSGATDRETTRETDRTTERRPGAEHDTPGRDVGRTDSKALVRDQKERFGGMKFGACFFGWLTATGTAVLLTALLTAIGAGVGYDQGFTPGQTTTNAPTIGLVSGIILLVVILVAYYCGGYVAGRMARFNGLKQGLGVWLWAIIIAVVVTILGFIAGDRFNVLSRLDGLPALPVGGGDLTTGAIITAAAVAVVALLGAILGGLAGMRFHRRIDHATFDTPTS